MITARNGPVAVTQQFRNPRPAESWPIKEKRWPADVFFMRSFRQELLHPLDSAGTLLVNTLPRASRDSTVADKVALSEDMLYYYDFFAGAGLVNLGLRDFWQCIWANDIDPRKSDVHRRNFPSSRFELGDVAGVKASSLPPGADMAWASFPCQDLSLAGWGRGMSAERSGAFWPFWRLMQDLFDRGDRPPLIVIENVLGMLYGQNFIGLCGALAALGMQFGAVMIDAKHFVPQSRPRVFVIAVDSRVDCRRYASDAPTLSPWFPKPLLSAVSVLPEPIRPAWRWWKLPAPFGSVPRIEDLIEPDQRGMEWHPAAETKRLLEMMSPANLRKVEKARLPANRSVGLLYRRIRGGKQRAEIRFDGLSGCLRTPNGGSSRQTVVIVEDGRVRSRLLTPREAARLMGVPDSFLLPERYNDAYRAMGDGVAVPAVAWLSKKLLVPLGRLCRLAGTEARGGISGADADLHLASLRRMAESRAAEWEQRG